jgi:protein XagA
MIKRITLSLCLVGIAFSSMAGGGWPQPKGKGYFKLGQSYLFSAQYYDGLGNIIALTPSYGFFSTSFYGEYGITNRLTGIIYMPFFARAVKNELQYNQSGIREAGDALNSFGDTDISIKYGLIVNKPIVVSASILFGLPLGNNGAGNASALQTGDGEFNQMLRIDASHSFHPKPVYVSVYAAFNNRTKGFSDEVRFGAEVGLTLKKFIPILKLNVVKSLFNGDFAASENGSSIFSNNTEYVSPTIELNYQITDKVGVTGSGGFAFAAKNILASPNWGLGVYLKL